MDAPAPRNTFSLYLSRRMAVLLLLGFSSGLPLMLTGRTLKVWAVNRNVDLTTVGLFSLLAMPYSLKFLWAPVLDRFSPGRLGRRKGWLLVTQLALIALIACMGFCGPGAASGSLWTFVGLGLAVAFFSATQDIVADAYRTDVLAPVELGVGASVFTTGYRMAMLATGAGAVALADIMPWPVIYTVAAAGMGVGVIATLAAPQPPRVTPPPSLWQAVVHPFSEFFSRTGSRGFWVLLFLVTFKLPDQTAAAMVDALLLRQLHFSNSEVAVWSLGLGVAAAIPGALLGGPLVARWGMTRSLVVFGLAQALSNAGYWLLSVTGKSYVMMVGVVCIEYFCAGLVTAGFMAFLMSQCNPRHSATQLALFTSLMALVGNNIAAGSGKLVETVGFPWFFALTILAGLPGMALLWMLPGRTAAAGGVAEDQPAGLATPAMLEPG